MQSQKGIKWAVWGLLVLCLSQMLYIYISSPNRPDPDKVISTTKVSGGGAIYEILYNSGGATVPYVYRYFLMPLQLNDEEALQKSKESTPFLVTKSSQAVREVLDGKVRLKTESTIYEFRNISIFKIADEIHIVSFDLDSTTP